MKDNLRSGLFEIRHKLFMLASTNEGLNYDDKLYREFELLLNGTIRYAYKINFLETCVISKVRRKKYPYAKCELSLEKKNEKFKKNHYEKIELIQEIEVLKNKMNYEVVTYLLKTSFIFTSYFIVNVFKSITKGLFKKNQVMENTVRKNGAIFREFESAARNEMNEGYIA